jgi:hypothetical protein
MNAELMALAPALAAALVFIVGSGALSGADHPISVCGCTNCCLRRLAAKAEYLNAGRT